MKFNRILLIVVSLALMLLALAGCGKDAAQDSQKKLNVVATTTMLTDLVKEIGGDHVSVQGLMGPGVDPHLYQASAGDVTTMSKADVVVYNGIHLEGKMGSIFDNLTKQNKATIRVSDAIDPATLLDFDEEDGVKTEASDRKVTQQFVGEQVMLGVEALQQILDGKKTIRHIRFSW